MATVEERLSRLEGVYEHLATKADIEALRGDFERAIEALRGDISPRRSQDAQVDNGYDHRGGGRVHRNRQVCRLALLEESILIRVILTSGGDECQSTRFRENALK